MSDTPLHSVSVAGVTFDKCGRVLLIRRRDNGEWQIPGGILEHGETFERGLRREVLEETGLNVEVRDLTGVYKNISRHVVALVYRCVPDGGTVACTAEASEVGWFDVPDALERTSSVFAIRVRDAFEFDGHPASRAHDGLNILECGDC